MSVFRHIKTLQNVFFCVIKSQNHPDGHKTEQNELFCKQLDSVTALYNLLLLSPLNLLKSN